MKKPAGWVPTSTLDVPSRGYVDGRVLVLATGAAVPAGTADGVLIARV